MRATTASIPYPICIHQKRRQTMPPFLVYADRIVYGMKRDVPVTSHKPVSLQFLFQKFQMRFTDVHKRHTAGTDIFAEEVHGGF